MFQAIFKQIAFGIALTVTLASAFAETKVEFVVDSRILIGFKVSEIAVGDFLPEGWDSFTLPNGPLGGANLIVAHIDRHLILDADGEPMNPSSGPIVVFLAYARKDGIEGIRSYVIRVYEEPPVVDPYGNSVPANIHRIAGFTDAGGGDRVQSELWTVRLEEGGELKLDLEYKAGGFTWSTGIESRTYSSENPDAFRIFKYDQLAGLAMNTAMGRKLEGKIIFSANDPALAALFNGSEKLVSVVSVPAQVRDIFLP